MTIKLDVLNFPYDNAEPAFTEMVGGYYHHRVNKRLYERGSFDAWLAAEGKTFAAGEVGDQSASYKATHETIVSRGTVKFYAVKLAPVTVSVTKVPSVTADDTGAITIAGGPADKPYTITFTVREAKSGGDDVQNILIAKGESAEVIATNISFASSDPYIYASAAGRVVTVAPSAGSTIAKLSILIT